MFLLRVVRLELISPTSTRLMVRCSHFLYPRVIYMYDNCRFIVPALEVLYKRVAPNAILNAGGRADEVRCHPGTREEVISRVEDWRDGQHGLRTPIFWLSGPAGAGKTAIVQTVAERCEQSGVPQANFFFFRADSSRNHASALVATLLHQILLLYPSLCDSMANTLSKNPLILDSLLERQLLQLVVAPLRAIQQSSAPSLYRPLVILLDGLDECNSQSKRSQRQILHVFDKILMKDSSLFRLLVASRDESQIKMAFNEISSPLVPIYLDDQYYPEADIRLFVNDEFDRVKRVHPLGHTLSATWPSLEDVEEIVKKSSGHFIYAATVMRFICDSSASPILSLYAVHGVAQVVTKSPFSQLDAIYTYILSQVADQETLKDILHAHFLIEDTSKNVHTRGIYTMEEFLELMKIHNPQYTQEMVYSVLADLTPIIRYTDTTD